MNATSSRRKVCRKSEKRHGASLRSCTTSIQPSYYYGDGFVLRGVKQVCGLFNICSRASSKFSRATKNRLRSIKNLEGVYDPLDLKPRPEAEIQEINRNATRTIYSIIQEIDEGPGLVFKHIFEKYFDAEGLIDSGSLQNFFADVQDISSDERMEAQRELFDADSIHIETMLRTFLEDDVRHGAVDDSQVDDMTKPLAHYWINSSHNTYLSGRQVGMKSANCAQYKRVLESGCRCIEVDVWENGTQLKVCHRSLTNSLDLKPVLDLIKETAFKTSPYPVILSIEQHLSGKSLKKLMQCIRDCFKGHLLEDRFKSTKKNVNLSLTPLEKLRNCVLLKMKGKRDVQADFSVGKLGATKGPGSTTVNEIISMAESLANTMVDIHADDSRHHTRNHLARVYPSSSRIDSSNYLPVKYWIAGCQMAALNFQKPGPSMLLNQALFNLNERRGYVPKPEPVLSGNIPKYPVEKLIIKILSGHRFFVLPRGTSANKLLECHLRASIHGTSGDQCSKKSETAFILSQDFEINTAFEFDLCLPEAAFLEISIHGTARIGTFTAVVSTLRRGIRFLHLTDLIGQKASPSSCLLVHIERQPLINEE